MDCNNVWDDVIEFTTHLWDLIRIHVLNLIKVEEKTRNTACNEIICDDSR